MSPKPRLFITATFQGSQNKEQIEHLCALARRAGFNDFCFIRDIEKYQNIYADPAELMHKALQEIERSDYLLIDLTDKPTGRAFETGMAFALGKKVIVIARKGTRLKDTTRGIAFAIIEYDVLDEILGPLSQVIEIDELPNPQNP